MVFLQLFLQKKKHHNKISASLDFSKKILCLKVILFESLTNHKDEPNFAINTEALSVCNHFWVNG